MRSKRVAVLGVKQIVTDFIVGVTFKNTSCPVGFHCFPTNFGCLPRSSHVHIFVKIIAEVWSLHGYPLCCTDWIKEVSSFDN